MPCSWPMLVPIVVIACVSCFTSAPAEAVIWRISGSVCFFAFAQIVCALATYCDFVGPLLPHAASATAQQHSSAAAQARTRGRDLLVCKGDDTVARSRGRRRGRGQRARRRARACAFSRIERTRVVAADARRKLAGQPV